MPNPAATDCGLSVPQEKLNVFATVPVATVKISRFVICSEGASSDALSAENAAG